MNILGTLRQVVYPYDVFERNPIDGSIKTQHGDPVEDKVATWTARALSIVASLAAVNVAVEEATGINLLDLLKGLF